jgi:two-component system phosphate regulon sensor histidine kinase PhoR
VTLSFRSRLLATHLLVVAAAFALMFALAAQQQRRRLIEHQASLLERAARSVAGRPPARGDGDELAHRLGRELGYRVTLIDSSGRVRGDSEVARQALAGVENEAGRPEVRAALHGATGRDTRRSRTTGRELLYLAIPVRPPGALAVLRLSEPLAEIAAMEAALLRGMLLAAAGAMLLTVPLMLWITSRQVGRIGRLARVAERYGAGDFSGFASQAPADELGRLGAALNGMAGRLEERISGLARERDETTQIFARLTDGVALIDPGGGIARANQSLARLLEAPVPATGMPFREFARSPDLHALLNEAAAAHRTLERDVRLWAPRPKFVRATATPLERPDGVALLLVLHDLTEREEVHRMRQDFVANVSHELRTPLTSVRGYAETLLGGGLDDAENREGFVRVIRDQTVRLQALVDDLMSLAELERPRATLRLERFNLRELVSRQAAMVRERAARAGLALEAEPGAPIPVVADRARIEQVIANLLDNAVKYTERGGIQVVLGANGARAWCEVRDSGPGIPAEELPRIFERFYRVDKARSRELGGTGLGLSIVKHIVTLHGGAATVESRLGHGSTFRFEIPLRAEIAPGAESAAEEPGSSPHGEVPIL